MTDKDHRVSDWSAALTNGPLGATLVCTRDEEVQYEDVPLPPPVGTDVRRSRMGLGRLPAGRQRLRRRVLNSRSTCTNNPYGDAPRNSVAFPDDVEAGEPLLRGWPIAKAS